MKTATNAVSPTIATPTTLTLIDGTDLDLADGSVLLTGRGGSGKTENLRRITEALSARSRTTVLNAASQRDLATLAEEIERREKSAAALGSTLLESSRDFPLILVVADDFGYNFTPFLRRELQNLIVRALGNQHLGIYVAASECDRGEPMQLSLWSAFGQLVSLDGDRTRGAIQPSTREALSS